MQIEVCACPTVNLLAVFFFSTVAVSFLNTCFYASQIQTKLDQPHWFGIDIFDICKWTPYMEVIPHALSGNAPQILRVREWGEASKF